MVAAPRKIFRQRIGEADSLDLVLGIASLSAVEIAVLGILHPFARLDEMPDYPMLFHHAKIVSRGMLGQSSAL